MTLGEPARLQLRNSKNSEGRPSKFAGFSGGHWCICAQRDRRRVCNDFGVYAGHSGPPFQLRKGSMISVLASRSASASFAF